MGSPTMEKFLAWLSSPLRVVLQHKTQDEVLEWLKNHRISAERLILLAQRSHILSIAALRSGLGEGGIPPGFPDNFAKSFESNIIAPFVQNQKIPQNNISNFRRTLLQESNVLQAKSPFLKFLLIKKPDLLRILCNEVEPCTREQFLEFLQQKTSETITPNSLLYKLFQIHPLLLDGMVSVFFDSLDANGVEYSKKSQDFSCTQVLQSLVSYRKLFPPTIPQKTTELKIPQKTTELKIPQKTTELEIPQNIGQYNLNSSGERPQTLRGNEFQTTRKKIKNPQVTTSERTSVEKPQKKVSSGRIPKQAETARRNPDITKQSTGSRLPYGKKSSKQKKIGKYPIIRPIGTGGMGFVYLAMDTENNRMVAIKKMSNAKQASEEKQFRFRQEAELARKLKHPNLVEVYDVDVDESPFIVMEYVEGTTLSELLMQERISLKRSLEIIKDIAKGLNYAHQEGIIHRDIKPSNIIITKSTTPKLMDFGLAKSMSGESRITKTGEVIGTPKYMAPEQARGKIHEFDARTDIYSIGAVLYELLTGIPPAKGRTPVEIIYNVVHVTPTAPRKLKPLIPVEVESICLKALEKEKEQRYQSAQQMVEDIERYLLGQMTIAIRRRSTVSRFRRWTKNNSSWLLPFTLTLITIICCLIALLFSGSLQEFFS